MMMKRKRATQLQLVTYSNGRPCRRGHPSLRYASTGGCVTCLRLKNQKYKENKFCVKIEREEFFIDKEDVKKLIDKIHELNFNREFDVQE
jgi:hypothetical protein